MVRDQNQQIDLKGVATPSVTQSSAPSIAVSCRGICKSFVTKDVEITALRGVDLDINTGEFMMLVGPSGCGKTTLISIIAGILKPSQGSCFVNGADFSQMSDNELLDFRAKYIGFIFQSFNLIPTLSLAENIAMPLIINATNAGVSNPTSKDEALGRANDMLVKMGLGEKANRAPSQLSGGEQQPVAIARALIHEPSLLICDEPTSALDYATGDMILRLMKDISRQISTTVVIVTHDARIFNYADRIAHMDDGVVTKVE